MRPWAFLLLVSLLAVPSRASDLTDLVKSTKPAVVLLEMYDGLGNKVGTGSGFFVTAEGWLVTNYHVIEPASRIAARMFDRETLEVEGVLAVDEANDLAVLQAIGGPFVPLALAPRSPREAGGEVVVLGGPLGLAGTVTRGNVSAIRAPEDQSAGDEDWWPEVPLIQIDAAVSQGSSGSPVMNLDGQVLGVVVSQYLVGQNLNFAVPVETLKELLNGISLDQEPVSFRQTTRIASGDYLVNVGISLLFFIGLTFAYRRLMR